MVQISVVLPKGDAIFRQAPRRRFLKKGLSFIFQVVSTAPVKLDEAYLYENYRTIHSLKGMSGVQNKLTR